MKLILIALAASLILLGAGCGSTTVVTPPNQPPTVIEQPQPEKPIIIVPTPAPTPAPNPSTEQMPPDGK